MQLTVAIITETTTAVIYQLKKAKYYFGKTITIITFSIKYQNKYQKNNNSNLCWYSSEKC